MLNKNIRDFREDNDLTQKTIAKVLNVDRTAYVKYENGKLEFPHQIINELADYYNTSTDFLYGRTRETKPYP